MENQSFKTLPSRCWWRWRWRCIVCKWLVTIAARERTPEPKLIGFSSDPAYKCKHRPHDTPDIEQACMFVCAEHYHPNTGGQKGHRPQTTEFHLVAQPTIRTCSHGHPSQTQSRLHQAMLCHFDQAVRGAGACVLRVLQAFRQTKAFRNIPARAGRQE